MTRMLIGFGLLLCVACDSGPGIQAPTWNNAVEEILIRHCAGCHGSAGCTFKDTCFLDDYNMMNQPVTPKAPCPGMTVAECIVHTIEWDIMPPGGCPPGNAGCMTSEEFETVRLWVEAGAPK